MEKNIWWIRIERTASVQVLCHALAGRLPQLLIHDAETSSAWIAVCARALPLHTLMPQFSHLATNVLGPSHANYSTWGMQYRVNFLVAPHGPRLSFTYIDHKRESALEGDEKGLSHFSQLIHVAVVWTRMVEMAIRAPLMLVRKTIKIYSFISSQ